MLQLTNSPIARATQQSSNMSRSMVMVNIKLSKATIPLGISVSFADSTFSTLSGQYGVIALYAYAVNSLYSVYLLSAFMILTIFLLPCSMCFSVAWNALRWTERLTLSFGKFIKVFSRPTFATRAHNHSINSHNSSLGMIMNEWTRFANNITISTLCFLGDSSFCAASAVAISVRNFIKYVYRQLLHVSIIA